MAASEKIKALEWLRKEIEQAPAPLREVLREMADMLMSVEVDAVCGAVCGAGYGERNTDRMNSRNGYRTRTWDTRVGSIDLAIPKLRQGTYFPAWWLEPRRRAERALTAVNVARRCQTCHRPAIAIDLPSRPPRLAHHRSHEPPRQGAPGLR